LLIAQEIVRSMPQDLIHELAQLEKQGLLEDTLTRALSRVLLNQAAKGLLAGVVRTNLLPLIKTTAHSFSQVNKKFLSNGNGAHDVLRIAPTFPISG
jgi:hypothetical protein